MLVSLEWLKEYVKIEMPPEVLAEKLSMSGTEVDRLTTIGGGVTGVVVAKVTGIKPHPNADNLALAVVDDGERVREVVCGAPNLKEGMLSGLALAGATLPAVSRKPLKSAVIRGVKSDGMLVSTAELGIGEDPSGILELEPGVPLGADLGQVLPLEDVVFDLEITPNRPDCMSMVGVAREVSALTGASLVVPKVGRPEQGPSISEMVSIEVIAPDECPRYTAKALDGVTTAASPAWMQRRLSASGVRPISNVVDVTNYVLLELGQPLHAFDLDLLEGSKISVRLSRHGETIITLDGIERQLDDRSLVIADGGSAVALAGIMGGEHSGVLDNTSRVLIESAYFDPTSIQLTSKRLGLRTEASARFERGTDVGGTAFAAARAADLMEELAGGAIAKGDMDVYLKPYLPVSIELRPGRANHLLGTGIEAGEMHDILERLGLSVEGSEPLAVSPPSFRRDLEREIDLIEEVARIHGYGKIEQSLPGGGGGNAGSSEKQLLLQTIADLTSAQGYLEAITLSFIRESDLDAMRLDASDRRRMAVGLMNPLAETGDLMRTTIIPGLARVAASNLNRGNRNLQLFETGRVFFARDAGLPEEVLSLCVLAAGMDRLPEWSSPARKIDFFEVKGLIENVASMLRVELEFEPSSRPWMESGKCAAVLLDNVEIGILGKLDARVASGFELTEEIFVAEIELDAFIDAVPGAVLYRPVGRFPGLKVDIAVIVDETIQERAVEDSIRKAGGGNLTSVRLFDVYRGEQAGAGRKSLAFALEFHSGERTLTDEEVHSRVDKIVGSLEKEFKAVLRSGEGT